MPLVRLPTAYPTQIPKKSKDWISPTISRYSHSRPSKRPRSLQIMGQKALQRQICDKLLQDFWTCANESLLWQPARGPMFQTGKSGTRSQENNRSKKKVTEAFKPATLTQSEWLIDATNLVESHLRPSEGTAANQHPCQQGSDAAGPSFFLSLVELDPHLHKHFHGHLRSENGTYKKYRSNIFQNSSTWHERRIHSCLVLSLESSWVFVHITHGLCGLKTASQANEGWLAG